MKDLASRPNFLARSVAWLLVALTATRFRTDQHVRAL